jgi:hypothetical protein
LAIVLFIKRSKVLSFNFQLSTLNKTKLRPGRFLPWAGAHAKSFIEHCRGKEKRESTELNKMGNINSAEISSSTGTKDAIDLRQKIHSVGLFNDAFVTSMSDKLPEFGYEEGTEEDEKKDAFAMDEEQNLKLKQLMKIFASESKNVEKVEDFPIFSTEKKSQSGFEVMRQRRARILIQLFKVDRILLNILFSLI